MSLTKLLFPARESLVSDIPAGDGKTANLFFTVYVLSIQSTCIIFYPCYLVESSFKFHLTVRSISSKIIANGKKRIQKGKENKNMYDKERSRR
jgi:hypothetical protein